MYLIDGSFLNQAYFCKPTFAKKNLFPVAKIVLFDTARLHLLTFRILEPYPLKDIALDLSYVISH